MAPPPRQAAAPAADVARTGGGGYLDQLDFGAAQSGPQGAESGDARSVRSDDMPSEDAYSRMCAGLGGPELLLGGFPAATSTTAGCLGRVGDSVVLCSPFLPCSPVWFFSRKMRRVAKVAFNCPVNVDRLFSETKSSPRWPERPVDGAPKAKIYSQARSHLRSGSAATTPPPEGELGPDITERIS
jgi:hypothetical protein